MARTAERAGPVPGAGGLLTLRVGWLRAGVIIPSVIVFGISTVIAVAMIVDGHWAQAPAAYAAPLPIYLITWVATRRVRLEITDRVVLARQAGWHGHPDKQVPRDAVTAIHYFPQFISFRGPNKKDTIMMIVPNYTPRQMVKVARVLDVPLYNHSRRLGLQKVSIGRLMYEPDHMAGSSGGGGQAGA